MVYGKYVILSDPYNSGKDIKMSWKRFTTDECLVLFCSTKNAEEDARLENALPKNYRNAEKLQIEKAKQRKFKKEQERIAEENRIKQEEFEREQKWNWDSIVQTFGEDGKKKLNDFNPSSPKIDKYNVIKFLNKYGVNIISKIDKDVRGLGKGSAKKTYILPIIEGLAELAKDKGVNQTVIDNFKKTCINQELDALFYTDEKVIMEEVRKMLKLINK